MHIGFDQPDVSYIYVSQREPSEQLPQLELQQIKHTWNKSRDIFAEDWFPEHRTCEKIANNNGYLQFHTKISHTKTGRKGDSPFKMFLIVPFGLFHICFKLNSFIRASSANALMYNFNLVSTSYIIYLRDFLLHGTYDFLKLSSIKLQRIVP